MKYKLDKKWRWLAMDKDGKWIFYSEKPYLALGFDKNIWCTNCASDYRENTIFNIPKAKSWKKSLRRIKSAYMVVE